MKRAIVLLSGGLDSATCLLIAKNEDFEVFALSFDYGQRHRLELDRAKQIAARYGAAEHRVVRLDLPARAASALTDPSKTIPKDSLGAEAIPITYVPARNTLFLAHAVAWGRRSARATSSSEPTRSITPATRTAGRSIWRPSKEPPTSARRPASKGGSRSGSTPRCFG